MATTTAFITGLATTMSLNGIATIDINETATLPIPNSGRAVVRLGFPSVFTGTTVTFTVQAYPASGEVAAASFRPLVDKDGNAVSYTVGANKIVTIPELSGCASFTIVSGSAEAAARAIEVASRGDNPVVSPTEVDVNIESGATITANQGTAAAASGAWPEYLVPQNAATATPTVDVSTAAEDNRVVKASAGTLYGFTAASTTAQYIQIFNLTAVPASGAGVVPFLTFPITANGTIAIDFGVYGIRCSTGIVIANSTTFLTYTDGGDDTLFNTQYV